MRLVDDAQRWRARSFGGLADDYDRARPSYPVDAVRWLVGSSALDVIDLGAGTGKLTAVLLEDGHRVAAIEPVAPLRAKLVDRLPQVRALGGSAEAIPLPDRCADAVLVGQAFHWFDVAPALAEISRVLRQNGTLGLLWNFRDDEQSWMRELSVIAGQDDLPDGWARELEALAIVSSLERWDFRLEHRVDCDKLLALVRSWSYVASLNEAGHQDVLHRVQALWEQHPQLARAAHASLTYRTEAYRVRLA